MHPRPSAEPRSTVFSRCCAISVSTVGTPVMSMIAISRRSRRCARSKALHDDLRAAPIERADHRQREDAVPELDDRRGQLEHILLLPRMTSSRAFLVDLGGVQSPSRSMHVRDYVGCRRREPARASACFGAQPYHDRALE